jgi:hypothetical protein
VALHGPGRGPDRHGLMGFSHLRLNFMYPESLVCGRHSNDAGWEYFDCGRI